MHNGIGLSDGRSLSTIICIHRLSLDRERDWLAGFLLKQTTDMDRAIGARLRLARRQMGLSQAFLACALGVSIQQIQKYEKGSNRIAASTLVRAAHALEISPAVLLGDVMLMPPLDDAAIQVVMAVQALPAWMQQAVLAVAKSLRDEARRPEGQGSPHPGPPHKGEGTIAPDPDREARGGGHFDGRPMPPP
jgi:transcriptional regulator with XRE-family HTH domain